MSNPILIHPMLPNTESPSSLSLIRVQDISRTDEEINPSSLHPRGNPFPPVFSLPSELLELIFIHGAREYYESSDSHLISEIPDWVKVSYVCRRWRDVALNSSTLWTYHFNLSLRWTEELMRRSRRAPLRIACIDPDRAISWWSGLFDNVLNNSERIKELNLHVPPSRLPDELFLHVPHLETLVIVANEPFNGRLVITDTGRPVLRTIALANCSLQWHLLNLSELKSLSLSHDSPVDQFNFIELLTTLCSMQDLTTLRINNAIPGNVVLIGDDDVSHKINLPRLALLGVNAPLPAATFFFSRVEPPLKTQISLALWFEEDTPPEDYAPISSFLAHRLNFAGLSPSSGPIVRSLGLYVGSYTGLTFSSLECDCRIASTFQFRELDSSIPLEIVLRNHIEVYGLLGSTTLLHRIAADLCRSLSAGLTNVQTLYVRGDGFPYKFRFWREVLECLGDLRCLVMERGYVPDLSMLSLAPSQPEEGLDGQPAHARDPALGRILVPALEKVVLHRMHFLPDGVAAHHSGMSQKSFLDMLATRNISRDKVIMRQCTVSEWSEA